MASYSVFRLVADWLCVFYDKFLPKRFWPVYDDANYILMVCFMYYVIPYSPGVIVRTEGEPLPSRKQKIGKWFRERFWFFVSLVFIFVSMCLSRGVSQKHFNNLSKLEEKKSCQH